MNIGPDELKRFQEAADINEIAMMLGRYVTLMDQFDAKSIYEELFVKDDPEVSVEYDTCGTYRGPENTRAFMVDYFHKNLSTITRDKHGWLDFWDAGTPHIVVAEDGLTAQATWSLISPKAKQATLDPQFTAKRTLTAFWHAGKMCWTLKKIDGEWKILHLHLVTYFTSPYHSGWLKQQECCREAPFWSQAPDRRARFYVYHPDQVYVKDGIYNWGPYISDGTV